MSKYAHNVVRDEDQNTPWFKILHWMDSNQDVLDVGCSSGYFGEHIIKQRESRVWGLEFNPEDAKKAEERGYQAVYTGDLDHFDWSSLGTLRFDSIIFADVLEHVKDPLDVLKHVKAFLKPGGHIFASIPNIAHISVRVELMEGNFDYEDLGILDNTHLRFFTPKTVIELFNKAGLEVVFRDATTSDVSDGQIKSHLAKLGLKPEAAFDTLLHSTEARTFQHVVGARISKNKQVAVPRVKLTSKLHDDWPEISKKMEEDGQQIKAFWQEIELLRARNADLEQQLRYIREHPVRWAGSNVARRVTKRVKPKHQ
jgi:2-polyprenyl-3-methyl-5-hydroxy-6-metoxy-1,4-benzoquinol methylase